MTTTDAAREAAHLHQLEAVERQGIALLDGGTHPGRLVGALYAVVTRLQIEGRFRNVDTAMLEDVMGQIATALDEEGRS